MPRRAAHLVGLAIGVAIVLGGSGSVLAAQKGQCPVCTKASDEAASYSSKAGYTLARGAANTLLGWTELIRQPATEVKAGGNVFTGLAKGVGHTVTRTFSGVGEVLTFWTPKTKTGYIHFAKDCPVCMGKQ